MFFPLHDENRLRAIRFQFMTIALIVANVIVFLLDITQLDEAAIASFAVVPSDLLGLSHLGGALGQGAGSVEDMAQLADSAALEPVPQSLAVPEPATLLTYMFFHGDALHLAGNMAFLWLFGDNVEDAVGHIKFLLFYLLCGIFAGLVHAVVTTSPGSPLIGASGAVSGVIAAYLMLYPRVMVWGVAFKVLPIRITAAVALGLWIATQFVMVLLPQSTNTAWWAHIGGLIAGAVLILFMRRPGVPLFQKDALSPGQQA
jgi:membrane associated rhomboid family serine protease